MADLVVLVRSRPFFGAQLVMFPALYQLKAWRPDLRLHVVARDPLHAVFAPLPWVDVFHEAHSWHDEWRAIGRHCEVLVGLHPSSERHGLLALGRRPPVRLGFRNGRLTDRIWTHAIAANTHDYRGLHFLNLLAAWQPLDPLQTARQSIVHLAATLPARQRPAPDGLVLMPGGGAGEFKKWGLSRFLDLAAALGRQHGWNLPVHVVLGPAEIAEAEQLRQAAAPSVRVWQQPSLAELAALVSTARLVVANDCGPSHLAQCAGTPLVSVFDSPKPEWFWSRPGALCLTPPAGQGLPQLALATVQAACNQVLANPGHQAAPPS